MKRYFFFILGLLLTSSLIAQKDYRGTISGTVVDAENKTPISGCYVYLSGYTRSVITNDEGKFTLKDVPNGIYELVFSHISFQKQVEVIELNQKPVNLEVRLGESTTTLETVYVTNVKDLSQRRRNLKEFKEFFFGRDYRASQIRIDNEQDIELIKTAPGIIQSLQDYTLNINNEYLGYNVSYYLKDLLMSKPTDMVLGFPKFTPKETNNKAEELYWVENRQRVFNGSIRHFFKALLSKKLEEEGFETYLTKADPEEESEDFYKESDAEKVWLDDEKLPLNVTIYDTETPGIKQINFGSVIEVNYAREFVKNGGFQNSKMKLIEDYVYVYENGVVVNPSALKLFGQWSKEGMYQMLPSDYISNDTLVLNDNVEQINTLNALKTLSENKPAEKIYLHTHSNDVFPGETIWYKAYLTSGPNNTLSTLSQNIYVELLDNNKVVKTHLIEAENGLAKGSMDLPDNIKPGKYTMRAYTSWMRNSSTDFFFRKMIQIHHPESVSDLAEKTTSDKSIKTDLQFFPEGGQLVTGLSQTLAFKAINQNGLPVSVSGVILDSRGNEKAKFTSTHDGMGSVEFIPEANRNYSAKLSSGQIVDIPFKAQPGIALSVDNISNKTNVIVNLRSSVVGADEPMFLIAQSRGWTSYTVQLELNEKEKSIEVPRTILRKGTVHFTVFNQAGLPLAERLIFNNQGDGLNIDITSNQNDVGPRGKTELILKVTDEQGNPVSGSFSMAALYDEDVQQNATTEHIDTYLLLSSDLKGYIHNPEYYFDKNNINRQSHLDLVMRTNGWTRFTWQTLETSIDAPIDHEFEKGIDVNGRLMIKGRKKGVKNGTVTFINNKSKNALASVAPTSRKGYFNLTGINPSDNADIMLKGLTSKGGTSVSFLIDSMERSAPIDFTAHLKRWNAYNSMNLFNASTSAKFQSNNDLLVANTALNVTEDEAAGGIPDVRPSIYGTPSYSTKAKDLTNGQQNGNIFQYMNGRIPGLQMTPAGPVIRGSSATAFGSATRPEEEGEEAIVTDFESNFDGTLPLMYLDNNQSEFSVISSIPVNVFERVELFKGPDAIILGLGAEAGAIMFFTKLGSELPEELPNGIFNLKIDGYHVAREFYAPAYDTPQQFASDTRKTIFWEPMITTDKNGLATISYFNTDLPGGVTISVEGLSFNGQAGHGSYNYAISIKE